MSSHGIPVESLTVTGGYTAVTSQLRIPSLTPSQTSLALHRASSRQARRTEGPISLPSASESPSGEVWLAEAAKRRRRTSFNFTNTHPDSRRKNRVYFGASVQKAAENAQNSRWRGPCFPNRHARHRPMLRLHPPQPERPLQALRRRHRRCRESTRVAQPRALRDRPCRIAPGRSSSRWSLRTKRQPYASSGYLKSGSGRAFAKRHFGPK